VVQGGTLRTVDASRARTAWIVAGESDDQSAQATRVLSGGTGGSFQLGLNVKTVQPGYRFRATARTLQAIKNTVPIACVPLPANAYAGNTMNLRASIQGGRFRVYVNGAASPVLDQTDPDPLKGGYPSFAIDADGDASRVQLSQLLY
jgi:hypothetical protein